MKKAKVANDGRLLCPECDDGELCYQQSFHQIDTFEARFDEKEDKLFMIGKPSSETVSIYDEMLRCPKCHGQFSVPWSEDGDMEQDQLKYEGDCLRELNSDPPPLHHCPRCGSECPNFVEDVSIIRRWRHVADDGALIFENYAELGDDATNERLVCDHCTTEWSIPRSAKLAFP